MNVTVVVATHGDQSWISLGDQAAASVPEGIPVVRVHEPAGTVATARNNGLKQVHTEFVCFLDGDDELHPDYFTHMSAATADVRAPAVTYARGNHTTTPRVPKVWHCERRNLHDGPCTGRCLRQGNWLVIGAVTRTNLIRNVGGFQEWPVYEDWDLWLRLHLNGATFEAIPQAIYIAHQGRTDHRNQSLPGRERDRIHRDIIAAAGLHP